MNEDLILTLQNYWFSEKEAKVYLAALSLWSAPASTIARHCNENRTTVYSILWDLVKRGLFSTVVKDAVTYYIPMDPELFVKQYEEKLKTLQEKLPELKAMYSMFWWLWKIKTFEWKNALKNLFLELATTDVDVKSFQWTIVMKDYASIYPKEEINFYRQEKIKKWIVTYRIKSDKRFNQDDEIKKDVQKEYKRKTLVLKNPEFDMKSTIHIYGPNKVSFLFFEENYPYVLIIENNFVYRHMNSIFDFVRNTIETNLKCK